MSPPANVDDLVPATISGSGIRRRSAACSGKWAASTSLRSASSSPRVDSARSTSASTGGSGGARLRRRRPRQSAWRRSDRRKNRPPPPGRVRGPWRRRPGRRRRRATSRSARRRSKPAASPGGFAPGQDVGKPAQPIARGGQLTLAHLRRHELRERQPQVRTRAPRPRRPHGWSSRRPGLAAACTCKPRRSGDRQRLRHHRHVLGDAGDRLAIEREARIRPSARRSTSARATSTAARIARTRGLVGRQPRQSFRLRQGQRLSADARRQSSAASPAQSTSARITPRMNGKGDRRRASPSDQVRREREGGPRSDVARRGGPCGGAASYKDFATHRVGSGSISKFAAGTAGGVANSHVRGLESGLVQPDHASVVV